MICFDTHVLIWGVQGKAKAGQEALVQRTRRFIHFLNQTDKQVMIPAPVVGEYLVGFSGNDLTTQKDLIQKHFFVPSLDVHAAAIQAEIEHDSYLIKKANGIDRQRLRVDSQIIAIALVSRAEKIISHDPHMRELAGNRIKVEEVPAIIEQLALPFTA
jgi:predicted nucleic acid-binding protein